mgnify:FL=1
MSEEHQIIPPSIFVWDLSKPNVGRFIIHTMEAANDLYTRGDVYDYGLPSTVAPPSPINIERFGFWVRNIGFVQVFSAPDENIPYIRNAENYFIAPRNMNVYEISPDWFRVYPPAGINEPPMWVRIRD